VGESREGLETCCGSEVKQSNSRAGEHFGLTVA